MDPSAQTPLQVPGAQPKQVHGPSRRWLWVAAGAILVLLFATLITWRVASDSAAANAPKSVIVDITASGFAPQSVTIKKGQGIIWSNQDERTRRISGDTKTLPDLQGPSLDQGDSYEYVPEQPGTYQYFDEADPAVYKGTIIVE